MIKLIAAIDEERGIGKNGSIPWDHPKDLQFFRFMTYGSKIVMGRKTFDSIGEPLKGRQTYILSERRNGEISRDNKVVARYTNWDRLMMVDLDIYETAYVCGGESVYKQTLNMADELILTKVSGTYGCDTFFPEYKEKFDKLVEFPITEDLIVERWKPKNR